MYLFYVVDGLDIKKIEKNEKNWIFLYQTILPDFFLIFPIFSNSFPAPFNPDRKFHNTAYDHSDDPKLEETK